MVLKMKWRKKPIILMVIFFLHYPISGQEQAREKKHTIVITGIAIPIFTFMYNVGISYDYLLTKPTNDFGLSVGMAGRQGYSMGIADADKLMSKGSFLRADIVSKFWWHLQSNDTRIGLFVGFSYAYVQATEKLEYEQSVGQSNIEVGSQLSNHALPGYIFGGKFQRIDSNWCAGFALGGLISGTTDIWYQLPGETIMRSKSIKLGSEFFIEAFVGYSF